MFGGLFSKPSVIDNEKLVSEKKRTIVQLKKKERKEKKRQDKREQSNAELEKKPEEAASNDEMDIDENDNGNAKVQDDGENADLEDKYMSKLLGDDEDEEEEDEDEAEDKDAGNGKKKETDAEEVVSETKMDEDTNETEESTNETEESTKSKSAATAKILDLKDKEFEKAERTVFIGNAPSVIISNKRETKDFKQFINKCLECPEHSNLIESVRFRSIHSTTTAPRKVAFIAKDVDLENVMNCYIVFKKKEDSMRALQINGVVYKDHHLRIDHLTHPTKKDNKLSIFVGNLDFQEKEEALWKYFNDKLLTKEEKKDTKNVIDNVRIVRDSKTSFGKGFAIIQFKDTNYVTKALLLDGKKMGRRALRITRCKKVLRNNETMRNKFSKLNDKQKTVVGRAKQLGKIDRRTLGKMVIEGDRAEKGSTVGRIGKKRHGGRKEKREKKARITKRSQKFKENAQQK